MERADTGSPAPLIAALSEIAARVQRARTPDDVLRTAGDGLLRIDMRLAALQVVRERLLLRYVATFPERRAEFEQALGHPIEGLSVPIPRTGTLGEVLGGASPVYREDLGALASRFFGEALGLDPAAMDSLPDSGTEWRGVLVPLSVGAAPWGILCLTSERLNRDDLPAVTLFASQVASAIEVAESIAELEQTNRNLARLSADRARESALVVALSEIATRVQRQRTVRAVLRTAAEGLLALDIRLVAMRIVTSRGAGPRVRFEHVGAETEIQSAFVEEYGDKLVRAEIPIESLEVLPRLLAERRSEYHFDLGDITGRVLAAAGGSARGLPALVEAAGISRGVVSPLFVREAPWGGLLALSDVLTPNDAPAVALFATHVGSALEVAESIEQLEQKNLELADLSADRQRESARVTGLSELAARVQKARAPEEVLSAAAEGLRELHLGFGAIELLEGHICIREASGDPESEKLIRDLLGRPLKGLTMPIEQVELVREVLAEGRSMFFDDLAAHAMRFYGMVGIAPTAEGDTSRLRSGARRGVLVPIRVRGRPWGLVAIASAELSPADVAPVSLFGAQIASALEVAESIQELEKANLELAAIGAVAKAGAEAELGPMLGRILEVVESATESDHTAICLYEPERHELVRAAYRPGSGAFAAKYDRFPVERSAGDAVATMHARAFHVDEWPAFSREEARAEGLQELAVVPMTIRGRFAGTLDLARKTARPYTAEELAAAERLAAQVAVQVEAAQLYADARRRVRLLSALLVLARIGSDALEVAPLASRFLTLLRETIPLSLAHIHVLHEDRLILAGHCGEGRGHFDPQNMAERPLDSDSLVAMAARGRRTIRVGPEWPTAAMADRAASAGVRTCVATPLIVQDRVVGTLAVSRFTDTPFGEEEVHLFESCATQVAVAIEHARLFEEERRRVEELSRINEFSTALATHLSLQDRLDASVHQIKTLSDVTNVFVMLLDADGKALRGAASTVPGDDAEDLVIPLDAPAAATTAFHSREPVVIDDAPADPRAAKALARRFGHRAVLAVPLIARGQVIGVVVLGDTREGRRFGRAEVDRTLAVASQVAVAIENARLLADARRRVDDLRLLVDVGRVITGSLDLEQILEASATALRRMVDASNTFVLLLDAPVRELRGVATSNPEYREQFRTVRIHLDQPSIAARAVRARSPQIVADVSTSSDVHRRLTELYGEKSLLALPLLLRDEPIGAVVIDDVRSARDWTESEVELATLIGQQVAIAVANARLFEDLRRSYGDLARAQEELVKRERLAALGELAAVVAHEVRNPLGVIFNSIVSLRKILQPSGDAAMLLSIVGEEADRLNRIVGDLLDFARPNEPSIQQESLREVIEEAVHVARSEASNSPVEMRIELSPDLSPLGIDARLVRQALLNVVLNGVQAMPKGGTLTVRASTEKRGGRAYARVDVIDTGLGIPTEVQSRMFQPFFTTKASGTGLGLAVVKRIVDAHRGEISVESRPGSGTTFTLHLPVDESSG